MSDDCAYEYIGAHDIRAFDLIQVYLEKVLAPKAGTFPADLVRTKIYPLHKLRDMRDRYARKTFNSWLIAANKYVRDKQESS